MSMRKPSDFNIRKVLTNLNENDETDNVTRIALMEYKADLNLLEELIEMRERLYDITSNIEELTRMHRFPLLEFASSIEMRKLLKDIDKLDRKLVVAAKQDALRNIIEREYKAWREREDRRISEIRAARVKQVMEEISRRKEARARAAAACNNRTNNE